MSRYRLRRFLTLIDSGIGTSRSTALCGSRVSPQSAILWTFGETISWFMQAQTICISAVGVQSGQKPAVSRLSYRSETTCKMQEHKREWTKQHKQKDGIEALVCFAESFRSRRHIPWKCKCHAIPLHSKTFLKLRGRDLGKHHPLNNENKIILSEALCLEALCAL
jgi:hypothetical protein